MRKYLTTLSARSTCYSSSLSLSLSHLNSSAVVNPSHSSPKFPQTRRLNIIFASQLVSQRLKQARQLAQGKRDNSTSSPWRRSASGGNNSARRRREEEVGKEEEEEALSRVNSLSSLRGKGNNRGRYYIQRDLFLNRQRWLIPAHNASSNQS